MEVDVKDYFIKKKSNIQIAKDEITENVFKQQGFYDMYHLGEISALEVLVNYIDKEICIAFLHELIKSKDTSQTIKKLSCDLIEKYSNEPKFEL